MMRIQDIFQYNRKISAAITGLLVKTPIKPNHVTLLGLMAGLVSGLVFAGGTRAHMLGGALALHVSFILDNCDGELARLKSIKTHFGEALDMMSDLFVDFALWIGLAYGALYSFSGEPVSTALAAACAGSFVNFLIVILERKHRVSSSVHKVMKKGVRTKSNALRNIVDFVSHNGDVITLVWIIAVFASPWMFLLMGAIYINALWMTRLIINVRHFV